jgi:hypothetical protein
LRVSRKDPVFVLPGLDCVFVQDPPYGAGAHDLAQRPSHSRGKIIQGLPANRFASFRDALTSQGLDQCVISRGKKWPYSRVRFHPPGKSFPPPSVSANDGPVGPIDPHGGQAAPGSSRGVHGPAAPIVIAARNDEIQFYGALPPEPLPRSRRGRLGNKSDWGQPWQLSSPRTCNGFLTGDGVIPHYGQPWNPDIISEIDH